MGSTIDNEEIMEDLTACLKEDESEDAELTLELRNVLHNLQSGSAAGFLFCFICQINVFETHFQIWIVIIVSLREGKPRRSSCIICDITM